LPSAYASFDSSTNELTFANADLAAVALGTQNFEIRVRLSNFATTPLYFPQTTSFTVTAYNDCRCTSSVFTQPTIAPADYVSPLSLITAVTSGTETEGTIDVNDAVGVKLTLFDI
jgi:hypothetical protein